MSKPYGYLALFETAPAIYEAATRVREAGYRNWDVLTPFPVHGLDGAMGLKRSKVPVFTLTGGVIGFFTGMLIAWYMGSFDYPLIVGGKPFFSPIFPFPVAYELTILLAAFGTLGGMFITNRLPMHYHPVMNYDKFRHLTDDKFAVVIEVADELFSEEETRAFLASLNPAEIAVINEEEA
ncbi:MAG: hypothetical protein RL648_1012 [Verrucomicrobiota bacterium]|jgi:hypothetical protein